MKQVTQIQKSRITAGTDTWLLTSFTGLLIILAWFIILMSLDLKINPDSIWLIHKTHPELFLADLFPLLVYFISKKQFRELEEELNIRNESVQNLETLLDKSTGFARLLSEGDDPAVPENLLDSDLGQALRLIQLNIKTNRRTENEKNWISEGKDIVSRILRIYNTLDELSFSVLKSLSNYINSLQGAIYTYQEEEKILTNVAAYAYNRRKYPKNSFSLGEGLVGQCAYEMDFIYRTEIPDNYMSVSSGLLGEQQPKSIVLVPLITNESLQGVMEFAFLQPRIPKLTIQFLLELGEIIARTIYNLKINSKTEHLLNESRSLTMELKANENKLQVNAEEMRLTQEKLRQANEQLEKRIDEAHNARNRLYWLLEKASEIIAIYDNERKLTYISPSVTAIFGYTPDEMMSGKDFERINREGAVGLNNALDRLVINPESIQTFQYTFIRKDGETLWLTASCRNLTADPSIRGFVVNSHDITTARMMEREQRLKTRMQALSENSLDFILRVSTEAVIYYANPIIEDYTLTRPAEVLNKNINESGFPEQINDFFLQTLHKVLANPVKFNTQVTFNIMLGERSSQRILSFDVIPEFQENELETVMFVGHDITEANRIEQEIRIINKNIKDSINYAERIQSSILPELAKIRKAFPKSIIWYKPRDVISGDIPWFLETEEAHYMAAIDCTGHGVPGALLSFVSFFLLNNIIIADPSATPGEVCNRLHAEIRRTLKQDRDNPETNDGMDLALCKIGKKSNMLEFAGAHRPMYHMSEGELTVFKGDGRSIGGHTRLEKEFRPFNNYEVALKKGDKIFIFSDGLTDQLGGEKSLKFGTKGLRELIVNNPGSTIFQYQKLIESALNSWMEGEKQLDDILILGIEF